MIILNKQKSPKANVRAILISYEINYLYANFIWTGMMFLKRLQPSRYPIAPGDLKIQDQFGCRALTYWFDEKRKTTFCLIEASNAKAYEIVKRLKEQNNVEIHASLQHLRLRRCAATFDLRKQSNLSSLPE